MKIKRPTATKKLEKDRIEFNRNYRKGQTPLTIDQYIDYLIGRGLPSIQIKSKPKPLKATALPSWASDPYLIPSAQATDYIPVRNSIMERLDQESEETKQAILKKKNQIALPYSKGAYQYVSDPELAQCLGRKL